MKTVNWSYPTNIWFGINRIKDLTKALEQLKISNPLIVTDKGLINLDITKNLLSILQEANLQNAIFSEVDINPSLKNVEDGIEKFKAGKHDGVIAFGGGSAMDCAKTIAFMKTQTLDLWKFEDIGDNYTKANTSTIAPIIAIPTTSGTGSEVGRATVITNTQIHIKKIIFHPQMLPKIVILDPVLTFGLPPHITAWCGMDALTHNIEAYVADNFHPMADGIAMNGILLIKESLLKAYKNGKDQKARADMIIASTMGATAFQKGLGSVHSIAHQLGGIFNTPHGLANAVILPYALKQNQNLIEEKLISLCKLLDLDTSDGGSFIDYIINLKQNLSVPKSLEEVDSIGTINEAAINKIAKLSLADPSTGTNAKPMNEEDFYKLFLAAYKGDFNYL